ncbi:hypothetical protein UlMin_036706 [Ulmus minor]
MVDKVTEAKLHVVCGVIELIQHYYNTFIHKNPCMNSSQTGNKWLREVLDGNDDRCFRMLRMEKKNLQIVLDAICLMSVDVLKPQDPEFKDIPIQILNDSRYMPHFKVKLITDFFFLLLMYCIGAIGVYVRARITPQNQVPFIGRKGTPTQNKMVVSNFDMQFIYALVGWEGNDHDARIFLSTLRDPSANFPKQREGKYYLVDAGYPQIKDFLGPYKNERYHLQVFRQSGQPEGYKEVFNHAHFSLRNKKWKILRDMPSYSFEKQVKIVIATMTLHNYIRRHTEHDRCFAKITDNYGRVEDNEDLEPHMTGVTRSLKMDALIDVIA